MRRSFVMAALGLAVAVFAFGTTKTAQADHRCPRGFGGAGYGYRSVGVVPVYSGYGYSKIYRAPRYRAVPYRGSRFYGGRYGRGYRGSSFRYSSPGFSIGIRGF